MLYAFKEFLRNDKITSDVYMRFRTKRHSDKFKTYDEGRVIPHVESTEGYRINLILPCFYSSEVFGGISTALRFFLLLKKKMNIEGRIIISGDEKYHPALTYQVPGFIHNKDLLFLSEERNVSIKKNDIFLCTSWATAFYFFPVLKWQIESFQAKNRKLIYLIQDYEPGFVPWSTEYVLAENTYKHNDSTVAVFNSQELYQYFEAQGYHYENSLFFKPTLNDKLRKLLLSRNAEKIKRRKRIIIYGRPVESRNAFGLIYSALKIWDSGYKSADGWEILSLGDKFNDIKLKNNTIKFKGKLTLEEYGNMMLTSYAGISFMVSPHPSYPPLEMSTFGVRTITNTFANKDLSSFNDNIISLKDLSPRTVADALSKVCDEYGYIEPSVNCSGDYVNGDGLEGIVRDTEAFIYKTFPGHPGQEIG